MGAKAMGTFIKRAQAEVKLRRADVETTVRGMIADIATRRDAAVRADAVFDLGFVPEVGIGEALRLE